MSEPLILKFKMTADELLRWRRAVLRHTEVGRQSRKAEHSIILMALVSLVVGLLILRQVPLMGVGLAVVGVLLLALPVFARYGTVKDFATHPQRDETQVWHVFPDRISGETGDETPWSLVECVIGTSDGFLLCRHEKPFIWLPLRAFGNKKEIEEFSRIAQGQVKQYESKV